MIDDNLLPFSFPAVCRKKVTAAFGGGRLTSDGGVMLLAMAEQVSASPTGWRAAFPTSAIPAASAIRAPT
jgi:hypothetical protein